MSPARTHRKHLSEPWFTLVGAGAKTVEGRLAKGSFAQMAPGDVIVWYNDDWGFPREVRTRITRVTRHATFRRYLAQEGLRKCLPAPGVRTLAQGVRVYRMFYPADEERRHGVLAIQLQLL